MSSVDASSKPSMAGLISQILEEMPNSHSCSISGGAGVGKSSLLAGISASTAPQSADGVLAETTIGTLKIQDNSGDRNFDPGELSVTRNGEVTHDPQTVATALGEICIANVALNTPYASLQRYGTFYSAANVAAPSRELDGVGERLAAMQSLATSFEAPAPDGITVDQGKKTGEGRKLYSNLFTQSKQLYMEQLQAIPLAGSADDLRVIAQNLSDIYRTAAQFAESGGISFASFPDNKVAFAAFSDAAWTGFQRHAAGNADVAQEYLSVFRECAPRCYPPRDVSKVEINRVWSDAARKNKERDGIGER